MLRVLLKKQLAEIFRSYFYDARKNTARSKGATVAYIVLFAVIMLGVLGGMFTVLAFALCGPMAAAGVPWLYFTLIGLLAVFLGVFGSVFNTYSSLYLSKDNDMLLAMPIPVHTLMISRLLSVYLMGLMYAGVVIVPAVAVYLFCVPLTFGALIGCLLLILLISVFVLTLSCALGFVVARISLKLKNKSLITVLISLVFLAAYYFFYFKAQTLIQALVENAAEYGSKIRGAAYPLYLFGRVGTGDWLAMLAVTAVVAALFFLMWRLISRSFLKVATATGTVVRRAYREKAAVQKSRGAALLGKEFRRFLSSPNYMLNCGLGTLLLVIAGAALLIKGGAVTAAMNDLFADQPGTAAVLLCAAVCLVASMNDITAPSVSLEGKSLWIVQSLPVRPAQVLRAKLALQLLLTGVPALFCLICAAVSARFTPAEALLGAAFTGSYVLLTALFGLMMGLKMPNLRWTNEVTPIKQGGAVVVTLFAGMLYALLMMVPFLMIGWRLGSVGYLTVCLAVTLLLCAAVGIWLKKQGSRILAAL